MYVYYCLLITMYNLLKYAEYKQSTAMQKMPKYNIQTIFGLTVCIYIYIYIYIYMGQC